MRNRIKRGHRRIRRRWREREGKGAQGIMKIGQLVDLEKIYKELFV